MGGGSLLASRVNEVIIGSIVLHSVCTTLHLHNRANRANRAVSVYCLHACVYSPMCLHVHAVCAASSRLLYSTRRVTSQLLLRRRDPLGVPAFKLLCQGLLELPHASRDSDLIGCCCCCSGGSGHRANG